MQKGRVFRINSFGLSEFLKKNSFLIIVFLVFLIGIFIGVFTFDKLDSLSNYSKDSITDFIAERNGASFGRILLVSFLECAASLFIVFLLGASLFGVITAPALVLFKGAVCGGMTAYLYSAFGIKGVAFNAVILIPATLVFLIILLVAAKESIKFSIKISSLTLAKTIPFNLSLDFKNFGIKYLVLAAISLLSALIDAAVSTGMIKHFNL